MHRTDRHIHDDRKTPPRSAANGTDPESESASLSGAVEPPNPAAAPADQVAQVSDRPGYLSLKAFLADNASLIFLVGSLTSLATFVVNLELGWLDTYLKEALLAAAVTVWFELHAQWPDTLRLDRAGIIRPQRTLWRLELFSVLMQMLPVLFVIWAVAQAPEIAVPLIAIGLAFGIWRRHMAGRPSHRWLLLILLAFAFLVSELVLEQIFPDKTTLLDLATISVPTDVTQLETAS